jgi:uncharacterized protein
MMTNFLTAKWENLIMANYAVDPNLLIPYLPAGTQLDFYNDKAYVSLVGFLFRGTKIFRFPIPGLGTFEEVNLRFYVTRKDGNITKRGVVFINETVPYKIVALVANYLYKEHYIAIPTKHSWSINGDYKSIEYNWKIAKRWNSISVTAFLPEILMEKNSIEEFIFEHYFGYTKIDSTNTEEYKINHPRWSINKIIDYRIDCDFDKMYGKDFGILNGAKPDSIMIAKGSDISVNWKRNRILSC